MNRSTFSMSVVVFLMLVGVVAAPAVGAPRPSPDAVGEGGASLAAGQSLKPRDQLVARDGLHTLTMQIDGNLVLRAGSVATWSSGTQGHPGSDAVLQADGNLVIRQGHPATWASGTAIPHLSGRLRLSVQDDGNLVLYRADATGRSHAVWSSGTPDSALKQIRVRTGCQATLPVSYQVRNAPGGLVTALVPAGAATDSALVCRYSGDLTSSGVTKATLLSTTALGQPAAGKLASALGKVPLGYPGGIVPCPAANESKTIIALHYPHRVAEVDIVYQTSGCRSLNNGYVVAAQNGNPPFGAFESLLGQLAPGSN